MKKYPLRLSFIPKSAIWSGDVLSREWGKQNEGNAVAETWEMSVRPKEMAVILNGDAEGMTLAEYFETCGADCVSPTYQTSERFPMLVKLIDAGDSLSVQVHPDDAYASRVENDGGKTEMWYIVEAKSGASIVYGLRDGIRREDFAEAVAQGRIGETLKSCPVRAGDCYFIPAGMVHAIGAGIVIAEIQQNSDLTYRLYDFERRQADGSLRELHTEKALDVVRPFTDAEIESIRFARGNDPRRYLANSRYFRAWKQELRSGESARAEQDVESFMSLLCIAGKGELIFEGVSYPISRGDSYFLPAGMGAYELIGEMTLIGSSL